MVEWLESVEVGDGVDVQKPGDLAAREGGLCWFERPAVCLSTVVFARQQKVD